MMPLLTKEQRDRLEAIHKEAALLRGQQYKLELEIVAMLQLPPDYETTRSGDAVSDFLFNDTSVDQFLTDIREAHGPNLRLH